VYRGFAFRKSGEKMRIINENIDNNGKENALGAHNPKIIKMGIYLLLKVKLF
jgi:hypothetical protein